MNAVSTGEYARDAMRKRLLLSLGLLACLFAGFVAVLWLTGPTDRINRDGFEQIERDMSPQDVQQVIGAPPGHYRSPSDDVHSYWDYENEGYWGPSLEEGLSNVEDMTWSGDGGWITVYFDVATKQAKCAHFLPPRNPTLFTKLRRWLGLPWW